MNRERALKVVLMLVGLLFSAAIIPIVMYFRNPGHQPSADVMLASLYVALGIFLLISVRNPSANRSVIAFTAWSSFAHGSVMALQALRNLIPRIDLLRAVLPLFIIGALLLVLAPKKQRRNAPQPPAPRALSQRIAYYPFR